MRNAFKRILIRLSGVIIFLVLIAVLRQFGFAKESTDMVIHGGLLAMGILLVMAPIVIHIKYNSRRPSSTEFNWEERVEELNRLSINVSDSDKKELSKLIKIIESIPGTNAGGGDSRLRFASELLPIFLLLFVCGVFFIVVAVQRLIELL